ncbi:homocysteine-responsive endoplasmic reticulum-resident ubiquitin-like domain member 2 protein [Microcaecilia unicolor]|uniref:Homocysteine-responsive endoplasmic reticulum-resident ubiquitin-like domain member 2 protein n=1 Tax=Microcaecilia unicolor TaxID=1415580 RepID=A0A6P7Y5A6_9AMPH|nr:homocysteine-responsive endoplasmic reticulum-resident ubiquitin-like domain member 2 protein [Microcaecilia unicolor]
MDQNVMDSPVTLVIKAPNQKYDDQTISCFLDWTVGTLKHHLSKVYPSKPSAKDQRLVYSGKLLLDHLQLKDILRKQDEYHMVHLVCASRTPPGSPKPSTSRESIETSSSSNSEHPRSSNSSVSQEVLTTSSGSSSDGLRQRNLIQTQSNPVHSHSFQNLMQGHVGNQLPGQMMPAGFSAYPVFSPMQMMWWQQMYARQYYMQYRAVVSAQATSSNESHQPATPVNVDRIAQNEPAAAQNVAAPENRPMNQNVQMNAQGGALLNEEDFNRDWLDWMYTFSRAAILLSIVYFYSSFSRFVMVIGAMLLVYLHQEGWFPFRQDGGQQQAANNADVNLDGQVNNPELQEMERLMDDGLDDDGGEDATEDANVAQQPGLLASAWSFITTFFTSLIPEGPPHAAN